MLNHAPSARLALSQGLGGHGKTETQNFLMIPSPVLKNSKEYGKKLEATDGSEQGRGGEAMPSSSRCRCPGHLVQMVAFQGLNGTSRRGTDSQPVVFEDLREEGGQRSRDGQGKRTDPQMPTRVSDLVPSHTFLGGGV